MNSRSLNSNYGRGIFRRRIRMAATPAQLMGEMEEAIRSSVEARIRLFGSEGKAA